MKVGTLYQLGRVDGNQFSKDSRKIIRENVKMHDNYVRELEATWRDRGKLFVVDEKATEEWKKRDELYQKAFEEHPGLDAKQLNKIVDEQMSDEPKKKPLSQRNMEELRADCEELGIEFSEDEKKKELIEKIKAHEA